MSKVGFKVKGLAIILALFIGITGFSNNAYAGRNGVDSDAFMRRYCFYINGKIDGLAKLVKALNALMDALNNIKVDLGGLGLDLTMPQLCAPKFDIGADLQLPGLGNLAACFEGLSIGVTLPDVSGLAGCLTGQMPSLDLNMSFNTAATLACLEQANFTVDIPALTSNITAIVSAVVNLIKALADINLKIIAKFDPSLFAQIKALAGLCKKAGLKPVPPSGNAFK